MGRQYRGVLYAGPFRVWLRAKEDGSISQKRHKPKEIVSKLRQVDVLVSQGQTVMDAIRAIGLTEVDHLRELDAQLQHQTPAASSRCKPSVPKVFVPVFAASPAAPP
jgi:hypothetical protein